MTEKPKSMKHNYTSELELKSLIIRIKNQRAGHGTEKDNSRINKYIKWHTAINAKKYDNNVKKNLLKMRLKTTIIRLSENTSSDQDSYEKFGEIILLMIKNILRKPQFSGYTYRDDFYSDAVYKILKYLHNFNHELISERTGQQVNAFAYISQIIHNSILFIIGQKKKDRENLKKLMNREHDLHAINHGLYTKNYDDSEMELINEYEDDEQDVVEITIPVIETTLFNELMSLDIQPEKTKTYNVYYPKSYTIDFEEYSNLKEVLKININLMRAKK